MTTTMMMMMMMKNQKNKTRKGRRKGEGGIVAVRRMCMALMMAAMLMMIMLCGAARDTMVGGAAHQTRKGVYAVRLEKGGNGKGMGMRLARLGNSIIVLGVVEGRWRRWLAISVGDSILSVDGDSTEGSLRPLRGSLAMEGMVTIVLQKRSAADLHRAEEERTKVAATGGTG